MNLAKIDKGISDISANIDFFSLLAPLNLNEESLKFFDAIKKGEQYNPLFRYKPVALSSEKEWLAERRKELDAGNALQYIFLKKIRFILTQIEFIESDDEHLKDVAVKLHGRPGPECINKAKEILKESKEEGYSFPEEPVTPGKMVKILQGYINEMGVDWSVALNDTIVPKVTVSGGKRLISINSSTNYTTDEIDRLKIHEVEVHVYRGANGHEQPYRIFAEGLAGYNETEEGLALVVEERTGCHQRDTRQMKLYAGRALCVDLCLRGSFYDTFMEMRKYFPEYLAYRLAERGKRGLEDTSLPGGFTKDAHYISGFEKVQKFLDDGGNVSLLYVGKVGLDDADPVKDLLALGELVPPRHISQLFKGTHE